MANKKFKDMVTECNDDAKKDVCNVAKVETTSKKNISEEAEDKNQPKQDDEGNYTYVMTDSVLINSKGTHVMQKWGWKTIANFPFLVKHVINFVDPSTNTEDCSFIVQVGNNADLNMGDPIYFNISNNDFSSCAKTRATFRKKQFTLRGKEDDFFQVLEAMPKVAETPTVENLGWDAKAGAFFFSNVCLKNDKIYTPNELGIIEIDKQSFFMPYVQSVVGKASSRLAETFQYQESDIKFNQWFQTFYEAHLEHTFLPTAFVIASMFRDIIFKVANFFPILFLKGISNSGKSSILRSLSVLFGKKQGVLNLSSKQSTPKGIQDFCSLKTNGFVWLDEFDNNLTDQYDGMLQSAYDGAGRITSTKTRTKGGDDKPITQAIALASNYTPEYEVFFTRTLYQEVNCTNRTPEQRAAFEKMREIDNMNLSCIAVEILKHRELIQKCFKSTKEELYKTILAASPEIKKERYADNLAVVLAPIVILLRNRKIFMVEANFDVKLVSYCIGLLKKQWEVINNTSKDMEFWNVIQKQFNNGYIKKGVSMKLIDGLIDDQPVADAYLAIRYDDLYLEYNKYLQNKARKSQEIRDLLTQSDYFCEYKKSMRWQNPEGKWCTSTALCFDYAKLVNLGYIFD